MRTMPEEPRTLRRVTFDALDARYTLAYQPDGTILVLRQDDTTADSWRLDDAYVTESYTTRLTPHGLRRIYRDVVVLEPHNPRTRGTAITGFVTSKGIRDELRTITRDGTEVLPDEPLGWLSTTLCHEDDGNRPTQGVPALPTMHALLIELDGRCPWCGDE